MAGSSEPTRVMMAVNESSIRGYPNPSISCRAAFDWMLSKLVRSNAGGFHILFLHVQVPDVDGFDDMDSIYASPADFQKMKQRDKIRGLHLLEYFVNQCHQLEIKCEAWIKHGDPKEVICSEVKRVQPDLLVVGSRGLGPFQRGGVLSDGGGELRKRCTVVSLSGQQIKKNEDLAIALCDDHFDALERQEFLQLIHHHLT
ncbi:hypothetical protein GUJ93_ZPchr0002g24853 [Zizania palustris]|uniref:DUF7597 domain-containing protein n=1 Tax=Zizania palustris TaxID=103762 RepID=A0A8J5RWN5_ZIZPA|nr:hypothetical protein GUJ93_ZPchr0002g24853 [Zizania palustris]